MRRVREFRKFMGVLYFYFLGYVYRDPVPLSSATVRVFTLIALLLLIGGPGMLPQVLLGAVIALTFGAGLSQLSVDINGLRISKFKDMIVSSPLNPITYAFGSALGMSIPTLLHTIPLLLIFIAMNKLNLIQITVTLMILALLWVLGVLLGFTVSLKVRSQMRLMAITDIIYSMLVYIMPVYYPITMLPEMVRPITLISPPVNAIEAIKSFNNGETTSTLINLTIMIIITAALTLITAYKSKWRE